MRGPGESRSSSSTTTTVTDRQDGGHRCSIGSKKISRARRKGKLSSLFPLLSLKAPLLVAIVLLSSISKPSGAVMLDKRYWRTCLSPAILNPSVNGEIHLQWEASAVNVTFDRRNDYNLNMTVHGNVTGQLTRGEYPPQDDPQWQDPDSTFGKIVNTTVNEGGPNLSSTRFARFTVLNYLLYSDPGDFFCDHLLNANCPVAPLFGDRPLWEQPAFTFAHQLRSSYGFTTIHSRLWVVNGDLDATSLACVEADITPRLGDTAEGLLTYLPLMVLVFVGIALASAAIFSPWGTSDIFRWTSNYGRDAIQLRLITPGFGDCLAYIQFVVLSSSLNLNYPGFYQPAVSQVSWSALMFNESFVTHEGSYPTVQDGIYALDGNSGLERMSQLVGMASHQDIWAGMMIWLLVIIAAISVLIQLGFAARSLYRLATKTQEEDMRAKNWPFTAGNAVRIVFNYFLLPVIALSLYQLTIANQISSRTEEYVSVVFAAITIIIVILFSAWLLWLIITARPRSWLFDDLPTVLLYGPLYNTYTDHEAPFALVPIVINLLRGIAIGAVQVSGIGQIVILAICEVANILALHAFRPFSAPTSMNLYHTIFSIVRLVSVLLMVAFIPELNIDNSPKGWIGYVILLLHGITLFVGFFCHALQTLIEVVARLAGVGGEGDATGMGGFVRAFSLRQLSRRGKSHHKRGRESAASTSGMLESHEKTGGTRSRSMSVSSNLLLNNRNVSSDPRQSVTLDSANGGHSHSGSIGLAQTPSSAGGGAAVGGGALANLKSMEPSDPYFRSPRVRRFTSEMTDAAPVSAGTPTEGDWIPLATSNQQHRDEGGEGPSISGRVTPAFTRERADSTPDRPKIDYATREVDYYYGVRGPALSHMPTRKLKTGPADPTGPVSSATGWFKSIFGGKIKDQGKGFEVIRSSRMPPHEQEMEEGVDTTRSYKDDPNSPQKAKETTRFFELDDEGDAVGGGTRQLPQDSEPSRKNTNDPFTSNAEYASPSTDNNNNNTIAAGGLAPMLPAIDAGSSIHLPSRATSKASTRVNTARNSRINPPFPLEEDDIVPAVPRRSSKRNSMTPERSRERVTGSLSVIAGSPPVTPNHGRDWPLVASTSPALAVTAASSGANTPIIPAATTPPPQRLPFGSLSPNSQLTANTMGTGRSTSNASSLSATATGHNRSRSGDSRVSALSDDDDDDEHGGRLRNSILVDDNPTASASGSANTFSSPPRSSRATTRASGRPESIGYVAQHRAADVVARVVTPAESTPYASTAELVEGNEEDDDGDPRRSRDVGRNF